jgi:hypothetical protein
MSRKREPVERKREGNRPFYEEAWKGEGSEQVAWTKRGDTRMHSTQLSGDEIVKRGRALYDNEIRPQVEATNKGKFLVINVETGDYEMDADDVAAAKRAKTRFGDAPLFSMRVGYPGAYRLGGRFAVKQP